MLNQTTFGPGRSCARARLKDFAADAGRRYEENRNFDRGPDNRDNVSMLSPYLRHRLITEREILEHVLRLHPNEQSEKFIDEIFWRAYFKGYMEHRPSVWSDYRENVIAELKKLEADNGLKERYEAALASRTGIHCFDAWVAELVETGYLHNHARMWFASIWVFTLGLPWQLGADFFYRHLMDGDPASNTLSWRWVCGLHTSGKTYLARASNIAAYTDNRFNPGNQLAVSATPLSELRTHPVHTLPAFDSAPVDERFGLLVTEEDCSPESLGLIDAPRHIVAALTTDTRSPLPVGRPARQFAISAVLDALDRSRRLYGVGGELAHIGDWGKMLLDWARREQLHAIVTAYAPVGPVAEQLALARPRLQREGIRLLQIRRDYDTVSWPHASKGYFRLKSRIPDILRQLDIATDAGLPQRATG